MKVSENEVIAILKKFDDMLENAGLLATPLRQIGWLLIKGLVALVDVMQGVIQDILTINGFFNYKRVLEVSGDIKPILYGALLFVVLYIGYQLMLGKLQEKSKVIQNVIFSMLVILLLPTMMTYMAKLTDVGIKQV
ncbi:hypothetical protein V7101_10260, partial [Bacillus velezensis]